MFNHLTAEIIGDVIKKLQVVHDRAKGNVELHVDDAELQVIAEDLQLITDIFKDQCRG